MYILHSGVNDLPVVRCTNVKKQIYCVVWDCQQEPSEGEDMGMSYTYSAIDYNHKPSIAEVKADIEASGYVMEDWTPYEEALR